jgi:hypothetical protein
MSTHLFQISVVNGDSTVNVETLAADMPAPRSTFFDYQTAEPTAAGGARGLGWVSAIWEWDVLTATQYAALRTLCACASAACWIRTLKDDYTNYAYYTATLRWPQPPVQQRATRRLQVRLEFVGLVAYTPTP